jgi:DegV family protein with EDD domain
VVVDSSSCLPPELLRRWNITVVPHELVIDGRSFRDGVDIQPGDFYQALRESRVVPTTAAPSPREFLEAFLAAGQFAHDILCLTLSANFSVTYRSALAAVELVERGLSQGRVEVVDSQAAAGASGLIALAAARWAHMGHNLEQVTAKVKDLLPKVNLIAFLDTLYYLRQSGRVGKIKAWTGSVLGIKPLTELRLGEARMLERPRSRLKAMGRVVDIMRQRVGQAPVLVNVMEADAPEDAQALLRRIEAECCCRELFVSQFTPVMGAHTGPGLLGAAFYVDEGEWGPS